MKSTNAALLQLLSTRQFFVADLYTFSWPSVNPVNGNQLITTTLNYTNGDADIVYNGVNYSSGGQTGPYFVREQNRSKIHQKIGVDVDQLQFDIIPGGAQIFGTSFLKAAKLGVFDGASLLLQRAFMPVYNNPNQGTTITGVVPYFFGRVAEVDCGRSIATFNINSHLELLNTQLPRNLYQPGCVNNLGDASCKVNLALYQVLATVTSATNSTITATVSVNASTAADYYSLGSILINTIGSSLDGQTASIRSCIVTGTTATINLIGYLPSAPVVGQTFWMYPGCDKTTGTGLSFVTTGIYAGGTTRIIAVANVSGVLPGMAVTGANVPANSTVVAIAPYNGGIINGVFYIQIPGTWEVLTKNPANAVFSTTLTGHAFSVTFSAPSGGNGCAKFANIANFRGFPFIPQPNTAI